MLGQRKVDWRDIKCHCWLGWGLSWWVCNLSLFPDPIFQVKTGSCGRRSVSRKPLALGSVVSCFPVNLPVVCLDRQHCPLINFFSDCMSLATWIPNYLFDIYTYINLHIYTHIHRYRLYIDCIYRDYIQIIFLQLYIHTCIIYHINNVQHVTHI